MIDQAKASRGQRVQAYLAKLADHRERTYAGDYAGYLAGDFEPQQPANIDPHHAELIRSALDDIYRSN